MCNHTRNLSNNRKAEYTKIIDGVKTKLCYNCMKKHQNKTAKEVL
jgi:Zn-finger protein